MRARRARRSPNSPKKKKKSSSSRWTPTTRALPRRGPRWRETGYDRWGWRAGLFSLRTTRRSARGDEHARHQGDGGSGASRDDTQTGGRDDERGDSPSSMVATKWSVADRRARRRSTCFPAGPARSALRRSHLLSARRRGRRGGLGRLGRHHRLRLRPRRGRPRDGLVPLLPRRQSGGERSRRAVGGDRRGATLGAAGGAARRRAHSARIGRRYD